ncbi:YbcC family protein [Parasulfitobacter algicola]|uniref:Probable inorganic carbon transporter subunit DabA n=1 Tax=Parasulfitobacter algicola TaxID=2614809 RepID=A0ABX2IMD3_9RHOB|nr:DUF2309 domain-containing protein [Sulfitobacter algicola]NSX54047.1 DUF2309 domain-containing protein [Sulfitobacter algicola]
MTNTANILNVAEQACNAIPPAWPLAATVAVNPFLGQSGQNLADTTALLARVAGTPVTMPKKWYLDKIQSGAITDVDLLDALTAADFGQKPQTVDALKSAAQSMSSQPNAVPTITELASKASGIDWTAIVTDRIGAWAAGYFDKGQALWGDADKTGAWPAWCQFAQYDLTPDIRGLSGFRTTVAGLPDNTKDAIFQMTQTLGLTEAECQTYFHQQLMMLGGWAQYARYLSWQTGLEGKTDDTLRDLLAISLVWEVALFEQYKDQISADWIKARAEHATALAPSQDQIVAVILQDAAERAGQRRLSNALIVTSHQPASERPKVQAAFCIDVRSEVFRRALEAQDTQIETIGFAGFFGLTAHHKQFASDIEEARLPVLLKPGVSSVSGGNWHSEEDWAARINARAQRAWGRFKLAAVSSFAFVEATGPLYAGKLLRDSFSLNNRSTNIQPAPQFSPDLDAISKADMAETILNAMSLTETFAPLVVLAGHGANVTNNAHESALHCGACGGYSGDVNARLLAGILNDDTVRGLLAARQIIIPDDTIFVPALHDTTTDVVTLYDGDIFIDHNAAKALDELRSWLNSAGKAARAERSLRLARAKTDGDVLQRALDWAEVRPEWGLAGCNAFIAAPRHRSHGTQLKGQAFLHSYDWKKDSDFNVLELIMTAPVVVASWISLQYYGSTVAPDTFGAGNKLLHNITGGIGVVEGNGGVMRAGLPWQSVHDGENYAHDPLRLNVVIEAPRDAMNDILQRHQGVRDLFDNGWLHLFAMDDMGRMAWRYVSDLKWQEYVQDDLKTASFIAA